MNGIRILGIVLCLFITGLLYGQTPEDKLKELGIELPEASQPIANYVKYRQVGNLVYLAGHGPCDMSGLKYGKVGKDLTIEEGYAAARETGICLLATLKGAIGDLSKVKQVVRLVGMVSSAPDFYDQPEVVNGCSDLLTEVFGESGKHTRAAVGMAVLPSNIPVEITMIVEVRE